MTLRSIASTGCVLALAIFAGCSSPQETTDPNKLCAAGAGVAARIGAASGTVDVCVSNDQATATFSPGEDRYRIEAMTVENGLEITIHISFVLQTHVPQRLAVLGDSAAAFANPGAAWFHYREAQPGVYEYTSSAVAGDFSLSVTDASIATGTFSNVQILLEDVGGNPAGSRVIEEGFFSVTSD